MTDTPSDADKKKRSDSLRKAYGEAATALRETYRDEFEALYVEKARAYGIEYKPKPNKAEKARIALAELLRENPELRTELVDEISKQAAPPSPPEE